MDKQQIIWLQRERENDPETEAAAVRRVKIAEATLKKNSEQLETTFIRAMRATGGKKKVAFLREVGDMVGKAFAPVIPCKSGCDHCCNIPLLMTQEEADVIGHEVGRPAAQPQYTLKGNPSYTGTPCPFLKDHKCSIYKHRPYVCRIHVQIDKDDLLCNLASETKQPMWNSRDFHVAELETFYGPKEGWGSVMPRLADIRDFFPSKGEK